MSVRRPGWSVLHRSDEWAFGPEARHEITGDLGHVVLPRGWIAPNACVVVVDGDGFYSRPGPRLADGVRQLGHLLHQDLVADPGVPLIELTPAAARP